MASTSETEMDSPEEQPLKRRGKKEVKEKMYRTKIIHFFGRNTPIILQDGNGPCPLIAICNILLLRDKLGLSPGATEVSENILLTLVSDCLIASNNDNNGTGSDNNQAQRVSDALSILPSFATGIDVDLKFKRIDDFEFTRERVIFDLLEIPVYHGWLVDPTDSDTFNILGSKSYNTVMEELVAFNSQKIKPTEYVNPSLTGDDIVPNNEEWVTFDADPSDGLSSFPEDKIARHDQHLDTGESHKHRSSAPNVVQESSKGMTAGITAIEAELIQRFLAEHSGQLTPYGLLRLQYDLEEGILCMFFRNNHFSTMVKYGGMLYTLVTDEGYINRPGVVWEKLNEVSGDTIFANSHFMSFKKSTNEIEEIGSSDDDEISDLDDIFKKLLKADKKAAEGSSIKNSDVTFATILERIELKERTSDRVRDFPSGLIVGREQEYSPWPRHRIQSSIPKRTKEARRFKVPKQLKDKCTSM